MLSEKGSKATALSSDETIGGQCRAYVMNRFNVCVAHSPLRSSGPGSKHPRAFPSRRPALAQPISGRTAEDQDRVAGLTRPRCETPPRTRQSPEARAAQRAAFARARRLNITRPVFPGDRVPSQPASSGAICIGVTTPSRRRVFRSSSIFGVAGHWIAFLAP
jgi:hypothetical protein